MIEIIGDKEIGRKLKYEKMIQLAANHGKVFD